jgi:hypothetical protein
MSIEAAQTQYRQAFIDQFEGKASIFRTMTTKESVIKGNTATFLVAGSGTDTAVTRGTNGQIPYGNPTNSQVTATLVEKHAPYELTGFNIFASQGDQKAVMRKASMNVINRDIDLVCLAELANATIDTGAYATASVAMVEKAKGYLPTTTSRRGRGQHVRRRLGGFMAYLRADHGICVADYVDVKPLVGPTRKMLRWNGVNWAQSARVTGVGTSPSFATCSTATPSATR